MCTINQNGKTEIDGKTGNGRWQELTGEPSPCKPLEEAELEVVVFDSDEEFDAMTFS